MDWNWSFRAFRLLGVDVRIHWSLPAFFLYYVVRGGQLGYSLVTLGLFVVLPMLLLFASVVAHEYGHVFAARHFGLRVGHMILTPIGGMVMVAQGRTPRHELVVAIAGPAVNLALAILAAALYLATGGPPTIGLAVPFTGTGTFMELWAAQELFHLVVFDFAQAQMGLFFFNMVLAAYPMDGGRVLMSILWRRRGFHGALFTSCKVARILAGVIALVGLVTLRPVLVIIAFFVFFQAQSTMTRVSQIPDPGAGWDPGFARAAQQQERMREAERKKKKKPSFIRAWWLERREQKLRALLARAETKGIGSLTAAEREWMKRVRDSR